MARRMNFGRMFRGSDSNRGFGAAIRQMRTTLSRRGTRG